MVPRDAADLVIVGAGTVGGWASVFAREAGARHVVVLERENGGIGASSRAAGMVRSQGGTPDTVRLGAWSIGFYRAAARALRHRLGVHRTRVRDPGDHRRARSAPRTTGSRCSARSGLDVAWVDAPRSAA